MGCTALVGRIFGAVTWRELESCERGQLVLDVSLAKTDNLLNVLRALRSFFVVFVFQFWPGSPPIPASPAHKDRHTKESRPRGRLPLASLPTHLAAAAGLLFAPPQGVPYSAPPKGGEEGKPCGRPPMGTARTIILANRRGGTIALRDETGIEFEGTSQFPEGLTVLDPGRSACVGKGGHLEAAVQRQFLENIVHVTLDRVHGDV
jgi:hypothetical protein